MSLKFIKLNVCFSIDSIAKLVRRSCDIDDLNYVFIGFNLLRERSQLATETDIVKRICNAVRRFGYTSLPYCIFALSNCSGDDGTSELSLRLKSILQSIISCSNELLSTSPSNARAKS